jgi:hypothetical protein
MVVTVNADSFGRGRAHRNVERVLFCECCDSIKVITPLPSNNETPPSIPTHPTHPALAAQTTFNHPSRYNSHLLAHDTLYHVQDGTRAGARHRCPRLATQRRYVDTIACALRKRSAILLVLHQHLP